MPSTIWLFSVPGLLRAKRIDLDAPQSQDQRRQEADLADAHHERPLRPPDPHPPLGLERLVHGLGRAAHRLHQHVQVLEPLGHADDVFLFIDEILGQKAVPQVDARARSRSPRWSCRWCRSGRRSTRPAGAPSP